VALSLNSLSQVRSLHSVATRVTPASSFAGLSLPQSELNVLRAISDRVTVGLPLMKTAGSGAAPPGTVALFLGEDRAQKSAAVEALAHELRLPLYRVDLGQLTSKYVQATEMHLAPLSNTAERGGAILFFDEADVLFGKRTEVKDSHDRYANNRLNLTPQMEQYRGLIVIAANSSNDVDPRLLERVRYRVTFPKPH
jgi:SpoVK/Ycf46/Vps4 family AAA+-type ATPase